MDMVNEDIAQARAALAEATAKPENAGERIRRLEASARERDAAAAKHSYARAMDPRYC